MTREQISAPSPLNRVDLLKKLKALEDYPDEEMAHIRADYLLLDYINDLDVTAAFQAVPRWYA